MRWLEASLPGATVCFTGRTGGVSDPPFDSLNLGVLTDDERARVIANRRRLAAAAGFDADRVAMGLQVHGSDFTVCDDSPIPPHYLEPGDPPEPADGQVTNQAGVPLLVLVADCLPVALSGRDGLAMLHCGWRGLTGPLVESAARWVGASHAVIGPGIGPCCFEVGEEVFDSFGDLGPGLRRGKRLDLWEVARRRIRLAGVERIETAGICTSCDRENFFSHRRDAGVTGRQAGIAWLQ